MRKNVRKGLQRLLAMVLTFAMVMTYVGCIGKVDAYAASTGKVTVKVVDKNGGEEIPGAQVIFTDYYDTTLPIENVTKNEDGSYSIPLNDDPVYNYFKCYAVADGYKQSSFYRVDLSDNDNTVISLNNIQLEAYPYENQLQTAITGAQDEINGYVDTDDYDEDQKAEIQNIRTRYLNRIYDEVKVDTETAET